jgi:hypothetical protein
MTLDGGPELALDGLAADLDEVLKLVNDHC